MATAPLRCFLAVFLDANVRRRLDQQVRQLRELTDEVRWVATDDLHVTLKFLGQITEDDVVQLSRRMSDWSARVPTHQLDVRGLGAFPTATSPRTIWAGTGDGQDHLRLLADAIEDGCARMGFRRESRRFHPHVTLGRRKGNSNAKALADAIRAGVELDFGATSVSDLQLVSSNLRRAGPEYVSLATSPLQ